MQARVRTGSTGARTARALGLGGAALLVLALAACAPEKDPVPTDAPGTPTASAGPTETPEPTTPPAATIDLPSDCGELYSDDMRAVLEQIGPLNDPGVTMYSTMVSAGLDVLDAATATGETLRCSWGAPSEIGLATNVTLVDEATSAALQDAVAGANIACAPSGPAVLCTASGRSQNGAEHGETHYFRDGVWITTNWLNVDPPGYTEDIAASLWG